MSFFVLQPGNPLEINISSSTSAAFYWNDPIWTGQCETATGTEEEGEKVSVSNEQKHLTPQNDPKLTKWKQNITTQYSNINRFDQDI